MGAAAIMPPLRISAGLVAKNAGRHSTMSASLPGVQTMNDPQGIRISKLMAERGLCSRREADAYIERGLVFVNGERVTQLGTRAVFPSTMREQTPFSLENRPLFRLREQTPFSLFRFFAGANLSLSHPSEARDHRPAPRENSDRESHSGRGTWSAPQSIPRPMKVATPAK
jgi:hypothetical protein